MNPAPNQPPVPPISNAPSAPPVINQPPPPRPKDDQPLAETNIPPPSIPSSPPPTITSSPPHHKFPFMVVTLFLVVILAGFVGSFLFLQYTSNSAKKPAPQIIITPPVTVIPTVFTNPFATPSSALTANPSASPTATINPVATSASTLTTTPSASPSGQ